MKLIDLILNDDNLNEACTRVIRAKGTNGVDKMSTSDLKNYLNENREELKSSIRNRQYKPSPVLRVEIPKDDGSKRGLGIPTVKDRMIQQAISQVLSPIYEEVFSDSSFGFRPKRNAHMAIERALNHMNQGKEWVVDIDLEKFFDKVNHDKLMQIVSDTIKDGDVISLIRKFLVSGIVIDDEYKEATIGTPQGGNLSPLLGNIILNELDKELESRNLSLVRYADDCLIFVGSEKAADRVMKNVTKYLEEELKLKVNVSKSQVRKPEGLKFLGFSFIKDRRFLYVARPHKTSIKKFKEKIKRITSRSWSVSISERLSRLKYLFRGWFNYFKHDELKTFCISIDSYTRFRLRMCIWKQWKTIRNRQKSLVKLGINKQKAWEWANSRKGYARVASSFIMQRSVTNEILKKKGYLELESLHAQYILS